MSSLLASLRRAVRKYPGGVAAIANDLAKAEKTFERELIGTNTYKLGAEDALEAMRLCINGGKAHAYDYVNEVCSAAGGLFVPLPKSMQEGNDTPRDVTRLMREVADVIDCAGEGDADGIWNRREIAKLQEQWAEVVAAGQALVATRVARYEADRERHRVAVEDEQ